MDTQNEVPHFDHEGEQAIGREEQSHETGSTKRKQLLEKLATVDVTAALMVFGIVILVIGVIFSKNSIWWIDVLGDVLIVAGTVFSTWAPIYERGKRAFIVNLDIIMQHLGTTTAAMGRTLQKAKKGGNMQIALAEIQQSVNDLLCIGDSVTRATAGTIRFEGRPKVCLAKDMSEYLQQLDQIPEIIMEKEELLSPSVLKAVQDMIYSIQNPTDEILPCPDCNARIGFQIPAGLGQTAKVTCADCGKCLNAHRGPKGVFFGPTPTDGRHVQASPGMVLPETGVRKKALRLIYEKWSRGELNKVGDIKSAITKMSGEGMPRDARWPFFYALVDDIYGPLHQPGTKGPLYERQVVQFDGIDKEEWLKKAESAWLAQPVYRIIKYNQDVDTKDLLQRFFDEPTTSDRKVVETAIKYAKARLQERDLLVAENDAPSQKQSENTSPKTSEFF